MKLIFIVLISIPFFITSVKAETNVIGQVYEIAEAYPVEQIKQRAAQHDWGKYSRNAKNSWKKNFRSTALPRTQESITRYHVPWAIAEKDVIDASGNIIYPKGFEYNPLEHMRMPYKIFVIDQKDVAWVKPQLTMKDMVLINEGNLEETTKSFKGRTFILDDVTRERLNITSIPSTIEQVGTQLKISEVINEN